MDFQKKISLFLLFASAMIGTQKIQADAGATGLIPLTKEQLQEIQETWPRIVGVRPNTVGASRIQEYLESSGMTVSAADLTPAAPDEEMITVVGECAMQGLGDSPIGLPMSVNNSTLPSFPPIGDQQSEGSCVGFGSTYYQATHEVGLLNGYNNKTSNANVLSPRWTYNLLNGGVDGGLYVYTAFNLLAQNGAASIASFPYINGDYRSWDLNPQDWINALKYRMAPAQYISGIGGATQNLQTIKQLLTNGHVLTYATYISSYVFNKILPDPANPDNPYVGQQACTYVNGRAGPHFMTIVGYDDNLWIDVNGNGQVDPGERGAFLVANSWGTRWGNAGFIWISYDAFLNISAVVNGPSAGRVAASQDNYVYCILPKAANYTPSLVGQFTLNQNYRNQISIVAGLSTPSQTTPTKTYSCYALQNQGGPYRFDGSIPGAAQSGTFAVDMSDFLVPATTQRYYLMTGDNTAGNPTTLSAFSLLDLVNKNQVNYSGTPLNCDNSQIAPFIDYAFVKNTDTTPPTVAITAPANNSTMKGTINVNVNATDNNAIAKVELYVDNALVATDAVAPYFFSLDTKQYSNASHQLTAIAYDTANNSSKSTATVNVMNGIFVNCGGGALTYAGNDFKADYGFSGTSSTYCTTNVQDPSPVLDTCRYGPNFTYNFNVPNGSYTVRLRMVESYFIAPGKRVFNIAINGTAYASNLDLYQLAGYCMPYNGVYTVQVTNGVISINFTSSVDYATVCAIKITSN